MAMIDETLAAESVHTSYAGTEATTTGWFADPSGRHEHRYFEAGKPSSLVADLGVQSSDPDGANLLERAGGHVEIGRRPRSKRRFILGLAAVLVLAAGVAALALRNGDSTESAYLTALRDKGLAGQFTSDANAVAHAHQVCRGLEDGGKQQGSPEDEIAVHYYCSKFTDGFHVLETVHVDGDFTISDTSSSSYYSSVSTSGGSCEGDNGYSDISAGTQVTVKNGKGDILTTTTLESGSGTRYSCRLPFNFDVTEGEDRYVVTVSHRGDISFSFADLKTRGVHLTLG